MSSAFSKVLEHIDDYRRHNLTVQRIAVSASIYQELLQWSEWHSHISIDDSGLMLFLHIPIFVRGTTYQEIEVNPVELCRFVEYVVLLPPKRHLDFDYFYPPSQRLYFADDGCGVYLGFTDISMCRKVGDAYFTNDPVSRYIRSEVFEPERVSISSLVRRNAESIRNEIRFQHIQLEVNLFYSIVVDISINIYTQVLEWCEQNGYTEPFEVDNQWWAYPPNGVMAVPLEID